MRKLQMSELIRSCSYIAGDARKWISDPAVPKSILAALGQPMNEDGLMPSEVAEFSIVDGILGVLRAELLAEERAERDPNSPTWSWARWAVESNPHVTDYDPDTGEVIKDEPLDGDGAPLESPHGLNVIGSSASPDVDATGTATAHDFDWGKWAEHDPCGDGPVNVLHRLHPHLVRRRVAVTKPGFHGWAFRGIEADEDSELLTDFIWIPLDEPTTAHWYVGGHIVRAIRQIIAAELIAEAAADDRDQHQAELAEIDRLNTEAAGNVTAAEAVEENAEVPYEAELAEIDRLNAEHSPDAPVIPAADANGTATSSAEDWDASARSAD